MKKSNRRKLNITQYKGGCNWYITVKSINHILEIKVPHQIDRYTQDDTLFYVVCGVLAYFNGYYFTNNKQGLLNIIEHFKCYEYTPNQKYMTFNLVKVRGY